MCLHRRIEIVGVRHLGHLSAELALPPLISENLIKSFSLFGPVLSPFQNKGTCLIGPVSAFHL